MRCIFSGLILFLLVSTAFGYQIFSFTETVGKANKTITIAKVSEYTHWLLPRAQLFRTSIRCTIINPLDNIYVPVRLRFWSKQHLDAAKTYVKRKSYKNKVVIPSVSAITVIGLNNLIFPMSSPSVRRILNTGQLVETKEIFLPWYPKSRTGTQFRRCNSFVSYLKGKKRNLQDVTVRFQFDPRGLPIYNPKQMKVTITTANIASVAKSISPIYKMSALLSPSAFRFFASDFTLNKMATDLAKLKIKFLSVTKQDVPFSGDTPTLATLIRKKLMLEPVYLTRSLENVIGNRPRIGELAYKIRFTTFSLNIIGTPVEFHEVGLE